MPSPHYNKNPVKTPHMNLLVNRTTRTAYSTIGDFSVNGQRFSYCLEPTDRGLTAGMTPQQVAALKVPGKTCIPPGTYSVTIYFSPSHQGQVPLVNNVPGFDNIEIHTGNYPKDTKGCLLLGSTESTDFIGNSDVTIAQFYTLFRQALTNGEQVTITYQ